MQNVPPTSKDTHLGSVENCKKPGQQWFQEMTSPTGCALMDVHEHFRSGTEPQYTCALCAKSLNLWQHLTLMPPPFSRRLFRR